MSSGINWEDVFERISFSEREKEMYKRYTGVELDTVEIDEKKPKLRIVK